MMMMTIMIMMRNELEVGGGLGEGRRGGRGEERGGEGGERGGEGGERGGLDDV